MYLGKREILNPEKFEANRKEIIADKSGAIWNAFIGLEGLINKSAISSQYFNRSQGWFSQKLNGATIGKKDRAFTTDESHRLAEAFRDIARRLEAHADEIDNAAPDGETTDE